MIRAAHRIAALVPLADRAPSGLPAAWDAPFAGDTVLGSTLRRLARCRRLGVIVLVKPIHLPMPRLPDDPAVQRLIAVHETPGPVDDPAHAARIAARKWSPASWRGGVGGMTCHDEPLAASAMSDALRSLDAEAALIVGPDWPLVDPELCDAMIERHLAEPESLALVFTQAVPGLAGCVIAAKLLDEIAAKGATLGSLLDYNPRLPQGDPIGKDPCVQIPPAVRDLGARLVFDAPRWQRIARFIESSAGPRTLDLSAEALATLARRAVQSLREAGPQQITLELNTDRTARGPIVPQHHTAIDRPPIHLDDARAIFEQLAAEPDVAVTLGSIGDPLLHPDMHAIVHAAHRSGVFGIHLETDLLVDHAAIDTLLELPIDVVSVRINADTPETYRRLMGVDGFDRVLANCERLLNGRRRTDRPGVPWVVPRLIKTPANVAELEGFLDRWVYFAGAAVIDGPTTRRGAMPDLAVLDMSPPRRRPCRQLARRMTIHADRRVALCDQDIAAGAAVADLADSTITDAWSALRSLHDRHTAASYPEACAGCREWHRP